MTYLKKKKTSKFVRIAFWVVPWPRSVYESNKTLIKATEHNKAMREDEGK